MLLLHSGIWVPAVCTSAIIEARMFYCLNVLLWVPTVLVSRSQRCSCYWVCSCYRHCDFLYLSSQISVIIEDSTLCLVLTFICLTVIVSSATQIRYCYYKLKCVPVLNMMATLPNIGGIQRREVWLMPTTRVPCSNAAKTRNPLKFAGVPQTTERISAVSGPKFTIL